MIGLWGGYSGAFLQLVGIGSFLVLGLPLLLRPLAWAKVFRWSTGDNSDLAVYFGRCVGAVVCVLSGAAILAARDPAVQPFFFAIAIANFALMVVVHAWGALRRIQPWTETAEIGVWVSLLILGLLCYPG